MPKVSVVVSVYNRERYLRECLDSVVNQTLEDIEILCVDDGSTDSSPRILAEYQERDKRIKIITKQNGGIGHTMNVGFFSASGDYIGCVDSDDFVDSTMYERLYDSAVRYDVDFIKADLLRFTGDSGTKEYSYSHGALVGNKDYYNRVLRPDEHHDLFRSYKYAWAGIFKRSFIQRNRVRYNESPTGAYQDNGFWFQTLCLASRVYFLDQPLYRHRRDNPDSTINSEFKLYTVCEEYDYIRAFLGRHSELKSEFICVYSLVKYLSYVAHYDRVAPEYKAAFLKRFSLEFKQALADGELDRSEFTGGEWRTLRTIMDHPDRYHKQRTRKRTLIGRTAGYLLRSPAAFFSCWRRDGLGHATQQAGLEIRRLMRLR